MRNVTEVPTAGILIKVGTNVPMMLPMVLQAPSIPTMEPVESREFTAYFTRDGVTVPRRNKGNTKSTRQVRNYAQMRRWISMATISIPAMAMMIYFPTSGMRAIQMAAIMSRR